MNPATATLAELFAADATAQTFWNHELADGVAKGWAPSTAEANATARLRERQAVNPGPSPRAWSTNRRRA